MIKWKRSRRSCTLRIITLTKMHLIEVFSTIMNITWTSSSSRRLLRRQCSCLCLKRINLATKIIHLTSSLTKLSNYCRTSECTRRPNTISRMWSKPWMIKSNITRCMRSSWSDRFTATTTALKLKNSCRMKNAIPQTSATLCIAHPTATIRNSLNLIWLCSWMSQKCQLLKMWRWSLFSRWRATSATSTVLSRGRRVSQKHLRKWTKCALISSEAISSRTSRSNSTWSSAPARSPPSTMSSMWLLFTRSRRLSLPWLWSRMSTTLRLSVCRAFVLNSSPFAKLSTRSGTCAARMILLRVKRWTMNSIE